MLKRIFKQVRAEKAQVRRSGQPYEGPVAWCTDPQLVPRPGYYAVTDFGPLGRVLADIPLVCVDDAPYDDEDGAMHFEYAGPTDYPQRRADGTRVERGKIVEMEAERVHGKAGIA